MQGFGSPGSAIGTNNSQPQNDGEHSVLGGTATKEEQVLFSTNYTLTQTETELMNIMVQSKYVNFAVTARTVRNTEHHPAIINARYALLGLLGLLIRKRQPRQYTYMQDFGCWMNRFVHGLSEAESNFNGASSSLTTPGRIIVALKLGLLNLEHPDAWEEGSELAAMLTEKFSVQGTGSCADKLKANFCHDDNIAFDLADFIDSVVKFSKHTKNTDAVDVIVPVAKFVTGHSSISSPTGEELRNALIWPAFNGMTYMTRQALQDLSGDARLWPVAVLFVCRSMLATREDVEIHMPLDYMLRQLFTRLGLRPSTTPVRNPVIGPLIAAAGSVICGDYFGAAINISIAAWTFCRDESAQRQHVDEVKIMITASAELHVVRDKATELSLSCFDRIDRIDPADPKWIRGAQTWLERKNANGKRPRNADSAPDPGAKVAKKQ